MSEITTVRFDGDNLQTVREGERVWVVLKRACEALGITDEQQAVKLKQKPWATTALIAAVAEDGKERNVFVVDLDTLPMWLATIDVGRVRPEAREKLIAYQRECAKVLRDHFFGSPQANSQILASILAELAALRTQVAELARENAWLREHASGNGSISSFQHRRIQAEVKRIAAMEAAARMHLNARAASASIYRAMGEVTGWGGAGAPWSHLPVQALPYVTRVLESRRKTAEKLVCADRQLKLVPMKLALVKPANDTGEATKVKTSTPTPSTRLH